ncbi:MAG: response regulator [Deltaproteobacteria bacterium]|nr:response regulator [Deltaproteobacteria bacterium]
MAKTALVVDDVAFARRVIKEILTAARYTVLGEAANGDEAIAMYKKLQPDFITMDVVMPIKGGIEATRKILEEDKDARIIMVSAMGHEQLLMEAINAGARDYILKPFSAEDLTRAVGKLLVDADDEPILTQAKGASHGA